MKNIIFVILLAFTSALTAQFTDNYYYNSKDGTLYHESIVADKTMSVKPYAYLKESMDIVTDSDLYLGTLVERFDVVQRLKEIHDTLVIVEDRIKYYAIWKNDIPIGYFYPIGDGFYLNLDLDEYNQ